jgi:serine/threonine-protein kinase
MIDRVGSYQVVRELGRGGMGVVYLAVDERLGREVAIKALPEHLADEPDRLVRFQREARVLASLNHPNIAGIHGLEESEGSHYLVLEYVEGESLDAVLGRGPLALDEAIEFGVSIARGLEAAHEKGIIHRDLKPANIMVTPDGVPRCSTSGLRVSRTPRTPRRASRSRPRR